MNPPGLRITLTHIAYLNAHAPPEGNTPLTQTHFVSFKVSHKLHSVLAKFSSHMELDELTGPEGERPSLGVTGSQCPPTQVSHLASVVGHASCERLQWYPLCELFLNCQLLLWTSLFVLCSNWLPQAFQHYGFCMFILYQLTFRNCPLYTLVHCPFEQ